MSYQIQKFNVNNKVAYFIGSDINNPDYYSSEYYVSMNSLTNTLKNLKDDVNTIKDNLLDLNTCEKRYITIQPDKDSTYNLYYRAGLDDHFSDINTINSNANKRLLYFPKYMFFGGTEVTVTIKNNYEIDIYELPYTDLNVVPNAVYKKEDIYSIIGVYHTSNYNTKTFKFTLKENTRRIAIVAGWTDNVVLYPKDITKFIESISFYEPVLSSNTLTNKIMNDYGDILYEYIDKTITSVLTRTSDIICDFCIDEFTHELIPNYDPEIGYRRTVYIMMRKGDII